MGRKSQGRGTEKEREQRELGGGDRGKGRERRETLKRNRRG